MRSVRLLAVAIVFAAAGLGVAPVVGAAVIRGHGLELDAPAGWSGRVWHGGLTVASFEVGGERTGFARGDGRRVGPGDVELILTEYESPVGQRLYCPHSAPPRLGLGALVRLAGREPGRRDRPLGTLWSFCVAGRAFTVFGRAGVEAATPARARQGRAALASFRAAQGDFYPGTVAAASFPAVRGWFVGSSGPGEVLAWGAQTETYAATVRYRDAPIELPPRRTVLRLGPRDILLWVGLSRDARAPLGEFFTLTGRLPLRIRRSEIFANWEGNPDQTRHGLYRQASAYRRGGYVIDLWVFFGAAKPSRAVVGRAQRMLDRLVLPTWPRFDT